MFLIVFDFMFTINVTMWLVLYYIDKKKGGLCVDCRNPGDPELNFLLPARNPALSLALLQPKSPKKSLPMSNDFSNCILFLILFQWFCFNLNVKQKWSVTKRFEPCRKTKINGDLGLLLNSNVILKSSSSWSLPFSFPFTLWNHLVLFLLWPCRSLCGAFTDGEKDQSVRFPTNQTMTTGIIDVLKQLKLSVL